MVKLLAFLYRKEGITFEEFSRYWNENHGPLVKRLLPGVRRYVQNHAYQGAGKAEPPFDGVAELWFDDFQNWEKAAAALAGEEGKQIQKDELNFLDQSKSMFFISEEKVIKE
ncbi:EthD domain-containing protein [Thermodesulfobacteriota bacterium]